MTTSTTPRPIKRKQSNKQCDKQQSDKQRNKQQSDKQSKKHKQSKNQRVTQSKKQSKKQQSKKQRGGLFVPTQHNEEQRQHLTEFLSHCNITKLNSGASGLVFTATLHNDAAAKGYTSPYLALSVGPNYKTPVSTLILKLCVIDDTSKAANADMNLLEGALGIAAVKEEDFVNEINIQTDLYLKTMHYLQPICPGIVYADLCDKHNPVLHTLPNIPELLTQIQHDPVKLGLIAMEIAGDSYRPMGAFQNTSEYFNYPYLLVLECWVLLLQLALDTGYTHGDHHRANILYDRKDDTYFSEHPGRPLLIDFGRTTKIPPSSLRDLKQLCSEHKYVDALTLLCMPPVANEFIEDTNHADTFYGWACFDYGKGFGRPLPRKIEMQINSDINTFFVEREAAIDKNVAEMNALHDQDPSRYPLLPLSDSAKNQLYNGLFLR